MERILIVDDNADLSQNLSDILKDEGYNILTAGNGKDALKEVKKSSVDLVLLDIKLPDTDGIKVLEAIKKISGDIIVIMLTAYADVKDSVKAMKLGALDYLIKPFDDEELMLVVKRAFQTLSLQNEVRRLREGAERQDLIMGSSSQIKRVLKQVEIVATTNMTVIIQGKSGTGKEVISRMIHRKSLRKDKPLIAIDCGAIPETLIESELFGHEKGAFTGAVEKKLGNFELANSGTLFLDEITNLPLPMQMKLLRVIEERKLYRLGGERRDIKIDVRIITAANIDLFKAVKEGKFREDLFHRLNEFRIELPDLHERQEDIPVLAGHFMDEANRQFNKEVKNFSSDAMKLLIDYHWPGNIRELRNIVRKAVLLAGSELITSDILVFEDVGEEIKRRGDTLFDLEEKRGPCDLGKGLSLKEMTQEITKGIERDMIKQALEQAGGNKSKAARILKIDRVTLYSKIEELGL